MREERNVIGVARTPRANGACYFRRGDFRRARSAADVRRRPQEDSRQRRRDDLSGSDVEPQPGAQGGRSDSRGVDDTLRPVGEGSRRSRHRASGPGRDPEREVSRVRLPASVLRGYAAASDDRDGAGLRAEAPHRGRADDGARRHDPGPDPRSPADARHRPGNGFDPDHARSRSGGRDVRTRPGDVLRNARRDGHGRSDLRPTPPSLHARPPAEHAATGRRTIVRPAADRGAAPQHAEPAVRLPFRAPLSLPPRYLLGAAPSHWSREAMASKRPASTRSQWTSGSAVESPSQPCDCRHGEHARRARRRPRLVSDQERSGARPPRR